MSNLGLKVTITGDAKGLESASKQASQAIQQIGDETKRTADASEKMASTMVAKLGHYSAAAYVAVQSLQALNSATHALIGTAAKFDSINKSLQVTSGSAALAADSMAFLQSTAKRLGTDLLASANGFASLQASAKGTGLAAFQVEEIFTSVSQAMAALGKSSDDTSGALLAIGQMMSKGTVSAEELRGQLGERLPGAFNAAAQAMGVTTEELGKMLERGDILAVDFLPKLASVLDETYSKARFDSIQNNINRISTAFDNFVNSSAEFLHVGDILKGVANTVTPTAEIDKIDAMIKYKSQVAKGLQGVTGNAAGYKQEMDSITMLMKQKDALIAKDLAIAEQKKTFNESDRIDAVESAKAAAATKQKADNLSALSKITTQYLTPLEKYNKAIADAKAVGAGPDLLARITDDYKATESKKSLATASHAATAAQREFNKQQEIYQKMREGANPDAAFAASINEYTQAYNKGAITLQEYSYWLDQLAGKKDKLSGTQTLAQTELDAEIDKYKQLTLSARQYRLEKLQGQGLNQQQIAPIMQQFDATAGVEAAKKSTENAHNALINYNKSLDDAKAKSLDLQSVTSSIFDGALGGINLMAGAFDAMTKSIVDNTQKLADNKAAQLANEQEKDPAFKAENAKKYAAEELDLNNKITASKLHGIGQVAGAFSGMLKKGSTEQRAAHAIQMAIAGVELAMNMQKILGIGAVTVAETSSIGPSVAASTAKGTAKAAEAVATQASAGPYIGFALMAAMAVAMAAIGFSVGGKGGGSVSGKIPTSPDSGTVLGDPTAKSESINKTYTLLQDIHAKEYRELRGINDGVAALQQGITNSITKLFQSGGLKIPAAALAMVGSGKSARSWDPIGGAITDFIFGRTKTKITDSGIYAGGNSLASILNGGQISAQQYTEITKTKKSLFGGSSSKVSEVLSTLDPEFKGALTSMFKGMGTSMQSMATSFGADMSSAINNYVIPKMKVSLHGLSSEQMIKKLNNVLSTQMDKMTTAIFGSLIKTYQKLGEGLFETASRLVVEKAVVLDAIDMTGGAFTGDAVAMADGLAQLAGGIKEFQASFQDYYAKFYSESEQLVSSTKHLVGLLADSGVNLPETRKGYRDLVNAQDLSTLAGRKMYTQLMDLAKAADAYYASQENLKKTAEDNLRNLAGLAPTVVSAIYTMNEQLITARENWNSAGLSLTEMANLTSQAFAKLKESILQPFIDAQSSIADQLASVNGTQVAPGDIAAMMDGLSSMTDPTLQMKQVAKIQKAVKLRYDNEISLINKTTSALKGISDFLAGLKLSDLSTLNPVQKLREAQGQYGSALLKAQAGNSDALASLPNLAKQYLDEAKSYYATGESYAAIFDQVSSVLSGLTDTTLTTTDAVKAATDAANASLTGSLTNLSTIIAGFVASLGAQFDSILSHTNTPGVGTVPGGLNGNGGTAAYNSLSANRDSHLAALGAARTNAATKGASKAYIKEQKAIAATELSAFNLANAQLMNYNYWNEQGKEDKAIKSIHDLTDYKSFIERSKNKDYVADDRKWFLINANKLLAENGGTLKFRARGGWTNGMTVVGEQGPELINFKGPAYVHNNAETQKIMAGNNSSRDNSAELVELRALVRLQATANQALLDRLDKIVGGIDGIERKARLESAA